MIAYITEIQKSKFANILNFVNLTNLRKVAKLHLCIFSSCKVYRIIYIASNGLQSTEHLVDNCVILRHISHSCSKSKHSAQLEHNALKFGFKILKV